MTGGRGAFHLGRKNSHEVLSTSAFFSSTGCVLVVPSTGSVLVMDIVVGVMWLGDAAADIEGGVAVAVSRS